MKHLLIASPTILAALVVLAITLHALYRARREDKIHKARCDARMAELERQRVEREAELSALLALRPTALVVALDLSDDDVLPGLRFASEQTEPLVSALSRQEQALGGAGLLLTAAKVEPGAVRLTLSPVERAGSAERVRRIADELNANGGQLPPGVTAAHADILTV